MTAARYIMGDCIQVMRSMPAESVDLVVTSPPFLGQRSYLADDDPAKALEHGMAGSPLEFVHELLDMVEEAHRVLAPHGSLVIELGDSMSGSGGAGGDYYNADGQRAGQPKPPGSARLARQATDQLGWPRAKSAALIPEMLRMAMAYGEVPYSGRQVEQWIIRNVVRWCKPNPSVGDEGDKFRRATNDMLVAAKEHHRYWDKLGARVERNFDLVPLLDYWEIPTGSYKGAHFATFPPELVQPLLDSMVPRRVCTTCGDPSRPIIVPDPAYKAARGGGDLYANGGKNDRGTGRNGGYASQGGNRKPGAMTARYIQEGWTDCGHDTWRQGVVLDPYAGTGTTLMTAVGNGLDAIGIDLDHRNADLAHERIGGLFLTIEHHKENHDHDR